VVLIPRQQRYSQTKTSCTPGPAGPGHSEYDPVLSEAATFQVEPDWTTPYTPAVVAPLARWTDPGDAGSRFEMVTGIESIVAVEAPVHLSLIHQRLRDAWSIGRVGARIKENIRRGDPTCGRPSGC